MDERKRLPAGKEKEPMLPGLDIGETREVGEGGSAERLPGRAPKVRVEEHPPRRRGLSHTDEGASDATEGP